MGKHATNCPNVQRCMWCMPKAIFWLKVRVTPWFKLPSYIAVDQELYPHTKPIAAVAAAAEAAPAAAQHKLFYPINYNWIDIWCPVGFFPASIWKKILVSRGGACIAMHWGTLYAKSETFEPPPPPMYGKWRHCDFISLLTVYVFARPPPSPMT